MRLPLATNLESRDGDLTQDARIKNGYIDTEEKTPNVHKRPGISLVQTTGDGSIPNDIFVLDDVAYVWRESDPPGTPTVTRVFAQSSEFADYEFDLDVTAPVYVGPVPNVAGGWGSELSTGTDIKVLAIVAMSDDGITQLSTLGLSFVSLDDLTTYGSVSTNIPFADFSAFMEVKLEDGFYNLYVNSVLQLSIENTFGAFITPTLDSFTTGSASVTNLQFTP
jgi:hypothetical protein